MKYDVLILYSGGRDSTLLLEMALTNGLNPYCLLIDYEQKHKEELEFAQSYCFGKSVYHHVVSIKSLNIKSKLTTTTGNYEGVSEWHVPSRNMMFVSIAASIAESEGIPAIWYGANYEDRENHFPDCYQEWVYAVNKLLTINGSAKVQLVAPLLGMPKELIRSLCEQYNIDELKIFSGYGEIK